MGCVMQVEVGTSPTKRGDPGTPGTSRGAAAAEPMSMMGYVRSREGALGILSMALLIFQGTALSLTLRYSRWGLNALWDCTHACSTAHCPENHPCWQDVVHNPSSTKLSIATCWHLVYAKAAAARSGHVYRRHRAMRTRGLQWVLTKHFLFAYQDKGGDAIPCVSGGDLDGVNQAAGVRRGASDRVRAQLRAARA